MCVLLDKLARCVQVYKTADEVQCDAGSAVTYTPALLMSFIKLAFD